MTLCLGCSFLFHEVTSLHPPSFHRNDFSTHFSFFMHIDLCTRMRTRTMPPFTQVKISFALDLQEVKKKRIETTLMPKRFKSIVQRATINKYRVRAVDTGVDKFPDGDCKFGVGRQEMRVEALIV